MEKFIITHNDNGFHICGRSYWFEKQFIELPLYHSCHTYKECIEWLDENYPNNYKIIENENKWQ